MHILEGPTPNYGEMRYLGLLNEILQKGRDKSDRTGVGTRSIFGSQLRFDLNEGFPLLTTKKIFTKGVFGELCWLISGSTNVRPLQDMGVHIWDEWADDKGNLGPVYGKQWRSWATPLGTTIDQLEVAVRSIKTNPDSRRIIVTAWNPYDVPASALPPCHMMFQFEVHDGKLSCHMYMRSADVFLGVPFNIASYAALTHLMAQVTNLKVGDLIVSFGDVHIYKNHFEQVEEQLSRVPRAFPELTLNPGIGSIDDHLVPGDFVVMGYTPHPAIKAEVAV
jgi:thymidylate synthase